MLENFLRLGLLRLEKDLQDRLDQETNGEVRNLPFISKDLMQELLKVDIKLSHENLNKKEKE